MQTMRWKIWLHINSTLHVLIFPYIQECIAVMPVPLLVHDLRLQADIAWVARSELA